MKSYVIIITLIIIIVLMLYIIYIETSYNKLESVNEALNTHIDHLTMQVNELEQGIELMGEQQVIVDEQIKVVKEVEVRYEKELIVQEKIIERARETGDCVSTLSGINELFNLQTDSDNEVQKNNSNLRSTD